MANGIGSCKLLYVFAILFVALNLKQFTRYVKLFKTEFYLILALIVYSVFEFARSGEPNNMRLHIVGMMEYFVLPFFIIYCINYIGDKEKGAIIKFMLIVGSVGAVITTACVISPSFNEFVRLTINKAVLSAMDDYRANAMYRGFGVSEALNYSYGIIQGMFFVFALYYYKRFKWALPMSFFIILSAALNARTGLVVAAFGLLLYFFYGKKNTSFLISLVLFLCFFIYLNPIFNLLGISTQTLDWLSLFIEESYSVISKASLTASDTTSYMFVDMLVFPRDFIEWIIGCGYDIYWSATRRSDLGWIVQLNYGGIIYMLLELSLLVYIYKRFKKNGFKNLAVFLAIAFIISNTKGPALPNSGIFRFIMLIYIYYIMYSTEMKDYNLTSLNIKM